MLSKLENSSPSLNLTVNIKEVEQFVLCEENVEIYPE